MIEDDQAYLRSRGKSLFIQLQDATFYNRSIGVSHDYDETFRPRGYLDAIKARMLALKRAFPHLVTMQYANFMPGE